MIFLEKPADFKSKFEVAVCYCESSGEVLLILRQPWEGEGGKWCLPGGMINPGEDAKAAVIREVREETGLALESDKLKFFTTVYVEKPQYKYVLHKFYHHFEKRPNVIVNYEEHADFRWVKPDEALDMDLLTDGAQGMKMYWQWLAKS